MAELRNTTFCTYNIKGYDGVAADTIKDSHANMFLFITARNMEI